MINWLSATSKLRQNRSGRVAAWFGKTGTQINGPLIFPMAGLYQPGAMEGDVYQPGMQQGDIYRPGMMAGGTSG